MNNLLQHQCPENLHSAVQRIQQVVHDIWPGTSVQPFGSTAYGLWSEHSDVDVVLLHPGLTIVDWEQVSTSQKLQVRTQLTELNAELIRRELIELVELVLHCKVPILRFWECESGLYFDCTVGCTDGPQSSKWVHGQLELIPSAGPLSRLLKQLLRTNELNVPYEGGVGGYCTVLLVIAFVRHDAHAQLEAANLIAEPPTTTGGRTTTCEEVTQQLIRLLGWLVSEIDYDTCAVAPGQDNGVCAKALLGVSNQKLAIQHPLHDGRDVAAACFQWSKVLRLFDQTRRLLQLEDATMIEILQTKLIDKSLELRCGQASTESCHERNKRQCDAAWGGQHTTKRLVTGGWGSLLTEDSPAPELLTPLLAVSTTTISAAAAAPASDVANVAAQAPTPPLDLAHC